MRPVCLFLAISLAYDQPYIPPCVYIFTVLYPIALPIKYLSHHQPASDPAASPVCTASTLPCLAGPWLPKWLGYDE